MENKKLLEMVGKEIFNLENEDLKNFVENTDLNTLSCGAYEFYYNDNNYIISTDEYGLESYALEYVTNDLLPECAFSTEFILDMAEIDKITLNEFIYDYINDEIEDIEYDLKKGRYFDVIERLNIKDLNYLYKDFENGLITEDDLKREIENYLDIYRENREKELEKEIKRDPIWYLNALGYSDDYIAKELQENGYFIYLYLDDDKVAKEAIRLDGIEHTLHIEFINSIDNIKVYKRC